MTDILDPKYPEWGAYMDEAKMVPREPTHEMILAPRPFSTFTDIWYAMWDAAPAAPAPDASAYSAVATLQRMGYTWHGGELWKPPLGPVPVWAAPAAPAWTDAEVDAAVIAAAREGEKGYRGIFMGEPLWRAIFRAGLAAAAPAKEPRIVLCQECGWEVQLTEHAQCRNCGAIPQHPPQDAAPDVAEILLDLQEAEGYVSENPNVHSLARLCKRAHALLSSQQTRIAELERERDGFKAECDLNLHRVLTCGVAAEHPNADLTRTGAYAEKWNTKQAESVRSLRTRADKAEAECARMKPLFDKACAIVDAWDGQFKHPLKPLVDAARAALKGEA